MLDVRGMTQADLIDATGLSRATINGLCNDAMTNTSTDTILKIASALHVSAAYFFEEHTYTPLELLDLPEDIIEFIKDLDSMDYLVIAKELKDKDKMHPDDIKTIIAAYRSVMDRQKSPQSI